MPYSVSDMDDKQQHVNMSSLDTEESNFTFEILTGAYDMVSASRAVSDLFTAGCPLPHIK